ncbi:MAG: ACT domain-containing protein [Rhizobiaceae bacterium]
MPKLRLETLPEAYAVSRLGPAERIPAWADEPGFVSISRTEDELSIVCVAERVPADIKSDGPWTCFKLVGPFAFNETGIALAAIQPLAEAGIGIFLVSTFDTDYLLVKAENAANARHALGNAGHIFLA